jgi:hypothetical protein
MWGIRRGLKCGELGGASQVEYPRVSLYINPTLGARETKVLTRFLVRFVFLDL